MKGYVTVKEAAKNLGVNPDTLLRLDRVGKLKAKRNPMNNYRLYSVKYIENLKKQIAAG